MNPAWQETANRIRIANTRLRGLHTLHGVSRIQPAARRCGLLDWNHVRKGVHAHLDGYSVELARLSGAVCCSVQRLNFGLRLSRRVKQVAQYWTKVLQSPAVRQVRLGKEWLQVSELKSLSLAKRRCESLFLELFILVSGVVGVDAYHSNFKAVTRPGLKRQQSLVTG